MVNGSNPQSSAGYSPYTGISVGRAVAVNPTNEEYKKIVGKELPYTLKYDYVTLQDEEYFPINILIENEDTGQYDFIRFLVSDRPERSSKGSFRFINTVGNTTWASSTEALASNSKMGWFTSHAHEPICEGFETLFNFMKALICYDTRDSSANWLNDMKTNGVTPERIFKQADVSGLREVIAWADNKDHSVGLLYSVKKVETENGDKFYQHIETGSTNRNLFFRTTRGESHTISNYAKKALNEMVKEASQDGYNVTSRIFTTDFKPFTREVEETPVTDPTEFANALDVV
jgi:hypothetical protein